MMNPTQEFCPNPLILLDMDEVLVDFVGGALQVHGWTHERLEAVWPMGTWSIVEPMGLTRKEFWAPIQEAGESFWVDLKPLPWISAVLDWADIQSGFRNWFIVTCPGCDAAWAGKACWLKNYFGASFDRFVPTLRKDVLAHGGSLLVDDKVSDVVEFARAGGSGIVFPSRRNQLYHLACDPVSYLERKPLPVVTHQHPFDIAY